MNSCKQKLLTHLRKARVAVERGNGRAIIIFRCKSARHRSVSAATMFAFLMHMLGMPARVHHAGSHSWRHMRCGARCEMCRLDDAGRLHQLAAQCFPLFTREFGLSAAAMTNPLGQATASSTPEAAVEPEADEEEEQDTPEAEEDELVELEEETSTVNSPARTPQDTTLWRRQLPTPPPVLPELKPKSSSERGRARARTSRRYGDDNSQDEYRHERRESTGSYMSYKPSSSRRPPSPPRPPPARGYRDSSDRVSSRSARDRRDSRERDAGTASRSTLEKTLDFLHKGLDELRAQVQASKESDRGRGVSCSRSRSSLSRRPRRFDRRHRERSPDKPRAPRTPSRSPP